MPLLTPREVYSPFEFEQAYQFWLKQQQAHWLHCVGPDERVFTSKGVYTVTELFLTKNNLILFNGDKFVESSPMLKTAHRELFKLKTKEGYEHTITKDHRVMTDKGWKEAQDLIYGDKISISLNETGFGKINNPELAFLIGHYQGDGTQTKDAIILDVWEKEYKLIPYIESCVKNVYEKFNLKTERYNIPVFQKEQTGNHKRLKSFKLRELNVFIKNKVPDFIWKSDKETVLQYLKGLFYTDGTCFQNKKHQSIKITQINEKFIKEIQLLLLMFGIKSSIYKSYRKEQLLPDGEGGKKLYKCSNKFTLEVTTQQDIEFLEKHIEIFKHKGLIFRNIKNNKKSHPIKYARFVSLESVGMSDVYCVSVFSDYKAWVANGFITHNTEVPMNSDVNDWKFNLTENEKHVIGHILKGFAQSEIFIGDYWSNFVASRFKIPEIQMMAAAFSAMESVHAVGYAYLNQTLGLEDFAAYKHDPSTKAKIDRLINTGGRSKADIARSLAIFSAFNEGVNLFSSFAILLNFKRFNKLKGVGTIIEWSVRDESLHSEAGCWLFRTLVEQYPEVWTDELKKDIYDAARLTIQLEDDYIDKAFESGEIEGISAFDLKQYLRFRCNTKLEDIGLKKNWRNIDTDAVKRITSWFEPMTSGTQHTDFFAARVSNYSKGHINFSNIWD